MRQMKKKEERKENNKNIDMTVNIEKWRKMYSISNMRIYTLLINGLLYHLAVMRFASSVEYFCAQCCLLKDVPRERNKFKDITPVHDDVSIGVPTVTIKPEHHSI